MFTRMSDIDTPKMKAYPTGLDWLDGPLGGGLPERGLILVSGDPNAGKTTLSLQMGRNISKRFKANTVFVEVEMNPHTFSNLYRVRLGLDDRLLLCFPQKLADFWGAMMQLVRMPGPKFLFIDSLQGLSGNRHVKSNEKLLHDIKKHLVDTAGMCVTILCQAEAGGDRILGGTALTHPCDIHLHIRDLSKRKKEDWGSEDRELTFEKSRFAKKGEKILAKIVQNGYRAM